MFKHNIRGPIPKEEFDWWEDQFGYKLYDETFIHAFFTEVTIQTEDQNLIFLLKYSEYISSYMDTGSASIPHNLRFKPTTIWIKKGGWNIYDSTRGV
jgi:hypothetical protein